MGKPKQRSGYSKKRSFHGNQFVSKTKEHRKESNGDQAGISSVITPGPTTELDHSFATISSVDRSADCSTSISSSKVEGIDDTFTSTPKSQLELVEGYRLVDMRVLAEAMQSLICPLCLRNCVKLYENSKLRKGLASSLYIKCDCEFEKRFYTSERCGSAFEVNQRVTYAMRSCGQGYAGIEKFTTFMNMPPPMTANNYKKTARNVREAAILVAEITMKDAAEELRSQSNASEDEIADTAVSCDGTWQKCGYSSLNGVTTVISMENGKVLDIEPMTRACKACSKYQHLKESSPEEYKIWKGEHNCPMNYSGLATNMECIGTKRIFSRSIETRKLRYTDFYGDGDSKSHVAVKEIYPNITVRKFECIGHVQKHVGSRLRKLKQMNKGIGGKGKLTLNIVDKLQNFFGLAIRQNVGNREAMSKAIHASLFHVASSRENNWHSHCPEGETSWCTFKRDKTNGTNLYKPGAGLPLDIVAKLKPIYNDLSSSELLDKCLHGKTQNQNESFNGQIWERIPKNKYVGIEHLELGAYDAVANFNIGRKASVMILERLNIVPGKYTIRGCIQSNKRRLMFAAINANKETKAR